MSKKSYMSLLKEAIAEFDTSDTVEVKGPMLDPILSWDGDGELPIYKDAAGILERYYFNEDREEKLDTLDEADYENDNGKPDKGPAMKDAKGAGTEQAGTDAKGMDKGEEEIAKEAEEVSEKELNDKDVPEAKEYTDEGEELEMENAIIEKLIAEMEDEDEGSEEEEKEDEEDMNEMDMTYTGDEPKVSMPKEKKAKGPEEDTQGAGTQQAGTGDDEGEIPPRKDLHDQMVKPKKYTDENTQIEEALAALEAEMADDDEADEEAEKDLDVDKEMAKEAASAVPGGPSPKKTGEDWEDDEAAYSEAFNIFKEAIMEEEHDEPDGDEVEPENDTDEEKEEK